MRNAPPDRGRGLGVDAGTLDAVQSAVDNGRFDLEGFDKCPRFACLRANDRFETMRVRVLSRANAIRSALGIPVAV